MSLKTGANMFVYSFVFVLMRVKKVKPVSITIGLYSISWFVTWFRNLKTCLQSGSLEPVIDGDGCPINQKLVDGPVASLGPDDDGESWSAVSDKWLELVGKDLDSNSKTLPLLVNIIFIYLLH